LGICRSTDSTEVRGAVPDARLCFKKGDACVEVAMTAKHGTPASVVVVMVLPFFMLWANHDGE
jgi:hypothetical protein